jgi:hypothetical protein
MSIKAALQKIPKGIINTKEKEKQSETWEVRKA